MFEERLSGSLWARAAPHPPEASPEICMTDERAPEYKEADRNAAQQTSVASQPVVPTPRARQAVTGHNVRYVLGFGIVGIVIAFVIVYLTYFG